MITRRQSLYLLGGGLLVSRFISACSEQDEKGADSSTPSSSSSSGASGQSASGGFVPAEVQQEIEKKRAPLEEIREFAIADSSGLSSGKGKFRGVTFDKEQRSQELENLHIVQLGSTEVQKLLDAAEKREYPDVETGVQKKYTVIDDDVLLSLLDNQLPAGKELSDIIFRLDTYSHPSLSNRPPSILGSPTWTRLYLNTEARLDFGSQFIKNIYLGEKISYLGAEKIHRIAMDNPDRHANGGMGQKLQIQTNFIGFASLAASEVYLVTDQELSNDNDKGSLSSVTLEADSGAVIAQTIYENKIYGGPKFDVYGDLSYTGPTIMTGRNLFDTGRNDCDSFCQDSRASFPTDAILAVTLFETLHAPFREVRPRMLYGGRQVIMQQIAKPFESGARGRLIVAQAFLGSDPASGDLFQVVPENALAQELDRVVSTISNAAIGNEEVSKIRETLTTLFSSSRAALRTFFQIFLQP